MRKKWLVTFYAWFAFVSLFCINLDLFMSTIQPAAEKNGQENVTSYFDLSFMSQFLYLSVWTTVLVSVFGFCNLINQFTNRLPHWITGKNNHTFVASMSLIIFFIYGFSLLTNPEGIVGFNTWYKVLKSVLEHFITPILMLVFYFTYQGEMVKSKQYARRDGWFTLIFPVVYVLFIVIRAAMLYTYGPDSDYLTNHQTRDWQDGALPVFPYVVDPWQTPVYVWLSACLAIIIAPYGVGNLFNYLSNKSRESILKRQVQVNSQKTY